MKANHAYKCILSEGSVYVYGALNKVRCTRMREVE